MSLSFLEGDLKRFQDRFNTIFGGLVVCNLNVRQALILGICRMGVLKRNIDGADDKDAAAKWMEKFIKLRNQLNTIFKQLENERRDHGSTNQRQRDGYNGERICG